MDIITTNISRAVKNIIIAHRRVMVVALHVFEAAAVNCLAFFIRFEGTIPKEYFDMMLKYLPLLLAIRLVFYIKSGLYKHLWRYASIFDLVKILKSVTLGTVVFVVIVRHIIGDVSYPRSIYILDMLLLIFVSGGIRLFIRIFREYLQSGHEGKRVLLIGAGDAGEMIVRDMKNNPVYAYEPVGFIDADPSKKGLLLHGVPILGSMDNIKETVKKLKPDEIVICIPSANLNTIKKLFEQCGPFNIPIKTLPGMNDILNGKISVSQIRNLSFEELLKRQPVSADIKSVKEFITGKSVLVTGAGGSIGSELARHIIEYSPSELILLDRYENGLFSIDFELRAKKKNPRLTTLVGDILDNSRLAYIFSKHKPDIIFHAAAHKHVPLMEQNPLEAVKNNVFGTKNLLEFAAIYDAESFVMISTDKAVNPTNVMGATKRIAELLTISMNSTCSTRFTTVRFGNVLGSNGSVYHIFKEQLKSGGPITVTHPDMERFFMLIPEAVQLVLMAAAGGKGGEIFVLDMGEPLKIVDFAEQLIRLSGFVPHEDIKLEFTGLRPGEKLYEELFNNTEKAVPSFHEKLMIAESQTQPMSELLKCISSLERIAVNNSLGEIIPALQKIVPNFKSFDISHSESYENKSLIIG